ncbi:MAG TPA: biotin--[acetyl-CoA-carboxylase] ligase [Gemmataceae bacterium]|jgi:BirA family biotin operon repressor/biotin-[acetyl-CoA-carboxylase] ligase
MTVPPPDAEWSLPTRHVGRRVLYYDRLPSTLPVAAALAADPDAAGTAVLAGEQTAGRGQYGRSWACPPGAGVLLGVALAPPPAARRPAVLTAWAAVGVAEAVRRLTGRQARVKWPNDVLIRGKKVCGILIESAAAAGRPPTAVAGIGLNVTQSAEHFAAAGLPAATSLAASTGRAFDMREVADVLLDELDRAYGLVLDGELGTLEACWAWRVGLLGRPVLAEAADGTVHQGRLRALTFAGLELEAAGGAVDRLTPEAVRHLTAARGS